MGLVIAGALGCLITATLFTFADPLAYWYDRVYSWLYGPRRSPDLDFVRVMAIVGFIIAVLVTTIGGLIVLQ